MKILKSTLDLPRNNRFVGFRRFLATTCQKSLKIAPLFLRFFDRVSLKNRRNRTKAYCGTGLINYCGTGLVVFIAFLILPFIAHGATFEFVVSEKAVDAGDAVHISVYINTPESSALVAQPDLSFSEEKLWVQSFTIAPGWLPVVGEEYQLLDNGRGVLRRTAGFEGSVSGRVLFGTISGIARGDGVGTLLVNDQSFILDDYNKNILQESLPAEWEVKTRSTDPKDAPLELFDISIEIEEDMVTGEDPIVARVFFQSFGRVPTPVDVFFAITDEQGNVITNSEENIVVETEAVFTKRFEALGLSRGSYILHVVTRYNAGVEDSFTKPFSVALSKRLWWTIATVGIGIIFAGAFVTVSLVRRRRDKGEA